MAAEGANEIKFSALVIKVQTMMDGAIRIDLDMSTNETVAAAQLMECTKPGVMLRVVAIAEVIDESPIGRRTAKKRNRKSG